MTQLTLFADIIPSAEVLLKEGDVVDVSYDILLCHLCGATFDRRGDGPQCPCCKQGYHPEEPFATSMTRYVKVAKEAATVTATVCREQGCGRTFVPVYDWFMREWREWCYAEDCPSSSDY